QQGATRTMCSGLIWRAAKQIGLTLNTDKSDDINDTLPNTPDGLFFYHEDERQAAGDALYRSIYNTVGTGFAEGQEEAFQKLYDEIGALAYLLQPFFNVVKGLEISSGARQNAANQVTNCFASDHCETVDMLSDAWKHPGTGTSVSPDDLVSWDQYGLLEPLAYHSPRKVPAYEWRLGGGAGTACGTVVQNGQPVKDATIVLSGAQFPESSIADGTFRFEGVFAGHYSLTASKPVGGLPSGEILSATTEVDVVAGQVGPCVTLELKRPSIEYRRVAVSAGLFVFDEEDEEATDEGSTELLLSPTDLKQTWTDVSACAGLESRGNVNVEAEYIRDGAVLVTVNMTLHEGSCLNCSACNNSDLDGQLVRKILLCDDETTAQACAVIASGVGLGPADSWVIRDYDTGFWYHIENTDESSDEYIEVKFELHNYRQR
ncbi:MAG: carboxypeptidase-like regulatory domain-containing protein, partial [Polyangiaceae bacterium]